jgi:hypothetical protein
VTALAAATTACQEPPSYRLRWVIEGEDQPGVASCADSGLFQVRARVFAQPLDGEPVFEGSLRDEREFPCHPSELDEGGTVAGSPLPPGDYVVQVRGIDRAGGTWTEGDEGPLPVNPIEGRRCGGEDGLCDFRAPFCVLGRCRDGSEGDPCEDQQCVAPLQCNPQGTCERLAGCDPASEHQACLSDQLVCDCQRLTVTPAGTSAPDDGAVTVVEEGATAVLPEFVLVPPPECDDGIDNDRDGLIDVADPSCSSDLGDGTEGAPVGVTELRLELTLLGRNPAVECSAVPLRRLQLGYEDPEGNVVEVLTEPCRLDAPYFALLQLPAGPATFSVVGLAAEPHPDSRKQPPKLVTKTKTFEVEISAFGGTVSAAVDFGASDFLEPIVAGIQAQPGFVSQVGPAANVRYSCAPNEHSRLAIEGLRVHVLDGHGGLLDEPVRLQDGTVLDGSTIVDCQPLVVTEPVEWGSYSMVMEALSAAGEVCFSNVDQPVLMAPASTGYLFLPRVYDAGQVPGSCHDCETDADCGPDDALSCVGNVCQYACTSDADCRVDDLGDFGFTCIDGHCRR